MLDPFKLRKLSLPDKFGSKLYDSARVASISTASAADARLTAKLNDVMNRPDTYTVSGPLSPWYVPFFYSDPTGNSVATNVIRDDTVAVMDYALKYAMTGSEQAALQAVKIIEAWSSITSFSNSGDSSLAWYRRWPLFIQAAYLVSGSLAYRQSVEDGLKRATLAAYNSIEKIAHNRTNNWAAVGIAAEILFAGFLDDRSWFDRALYRWRTHFSDSIKSGVTLSGAVRNNVPIHEIYREGSGQGNGSSGLVYVNMTTSAFAMGAEYARLNGEWLFDYVSEDGSSLKGLFLNTASWNRNPTPANLWFNTSGDSGYGVDYLTPWVDILGALWDSSDADYLMQNFDYTNLQDVYTMRHCDLLYRHRELYG